MSGLGRAFGGSHSYVPGGRHAECKQRAAALRVEVSRYREVLERLVIRCDGNEGIRADGSNIDTTEAHAILGDFDRPEARAAQPGQQSGRREP